MNRQTTTTILCIEMQVKREDEKLQAFYNMTFFISKESNEENILLPKPSWNWPFIKWAEFSICVVARFLSGAPPKTRSIP